MQVIGENVAREQKTEMNDMARYVDLEPEIQELESVLNERKDDLNSVVYYIFQIVLKKLKSIPTADVAPRAEVDKLEYTLMGVMHSVDKWLDGDELKQDEVNRAITMREKTLRIVENARAEVADQKARADMCAEVIARQDKEIEKLQDKVKRYKRYYFHHDYDKMIAEVLDELDRFINSNCIVIKDERGIKGYVTGGVHFAIAEFKKKYTEAPHEP